MGLLGRRLAVGRKQRESEGGSRRGEAAVGLHKSNMEALGSEEEAVGEGGWQGSCSEDQEPSYWARRNQGFARPVRVRRHIKVLLGRSESGGM